MSGRGLTRAVWGRSGPGAVRGAVSGREAGRLVSIPAGVRHGAGEEDPVAEHDLPEGRRARVSTGHR